MQELLVLVIGLLALIGLLVYLRSRRAGGDPSGSVQAFSRALSAMEPGGRRGATPEPSGDRDAVEEEGTPRPGDASTPATRRERSEDGRGGG